MFPAKWFWTWNTATQCNAGHNNDSCQHASTRPPMLMPGEEHTSSKSAVAGDVGMGTIYTWAPELILQHHWHHRQRKGTDSQTTALNWGGRTKSSQRKHCSRAAAGERFLMPEPELSSRWLVSLATCRGILVNTRGRQHA